MAIFVKFLNLKYDCFVEEQLARGMFSVTQIQFFWSNIIERKKNLFVNDFVE